MKINVTREDITSGKPGKPTECMVALALKRELGVSYASVGYDEAKILMDGQYIKLYFSKKVEKKNYRRRKAVWLTICWPYLKARNSHSSANLLVRAVTNHNFSAELVMDY